MTGPVAPDTLCTLRDMSWPGAFLASVIAIAICVAICFFFRSL